MSKNLSATGKGTYTEILSDQSKQLTTRPLINGVENQHDTTASGFKQGMNNDRKFVTTGQPTNPYTPRAQGKVVQKGIKPFTGVPGGLARTTTTSGRYTVVSKSKVRVRLETTSLNAVDRIDVRPQHAAE